MEPLQRFDEQEIDGKPYWPAPVRVPAEQVGARLTGFVVHTMFRTSELQDIRIGRVVARQCPDAVRRKELILVEHVAKNTAQFLGIGDGEQTTFALSCSPHTCQV